jgi:hypothetical protein
MTRKTEKELLLGLLCAALYFGIWFLCVRPILYLNHASYSHAIILVTYFFGAIGVLLFFHRVRWARVAMSTFGFSAALILSWWSAQAAFGALIPNWHTVAAFTVAGVEFSTLQFAAVLMAAAVAASGLGIFGLWILKRSP